MDWGDDDGYGVFLGWAGEEGYTLSMMILLLLLLLLVFALVLQHACVRAYLGMNDMDDWVGEMDDLFLKLWSNVQRESDLEEYEKREMYMCLYIWVR